MNPHWKNFLATQSLATDNLALGIFPLTELSVLTVSGADATSFLQGQVTLNVTQLNEQQAGLGAICTPNGRVSAIFLLIKHQDTWLMIVPSEQKDSIKTRLSRFILRAKVSINDDDNYCLIGLNPNLVAQTSNYQVTEVAPLTVTWFNRTIIVATLEQAQSIWQASIQKGYIPTCYTVWHYLDITDGVPWLNADTAETYIPQMLNLELLGALSFDKGCYTGQEIIARTHYLGKAKRRLLLAEINSPQPPEVNTAVLDELSVSSLETGENSAGKVLSACRLGSSCRLLIVLAYSDSGEHRLTLPDHTPITLLGCNYSR